jgi:hypothetical protein
MFLSEGFIPLLNHGKKKQSSPATSHGSTLGERRYSSYSFTTSALDGLPEN